MDLPLNPNIQPNQASDEKRYSYPGSENRRKPITKDDKRSGYGGRLERENKKNAESLAKIFGLNGPKTEGDVLNQMRGMLKDYSDEGLDSTKLVHDIRDE
jgi:hypothetical protein